MGAGHISPPSLPLSVRILLLQTTVERWVNADTALPADGGPHIAAVQCAGQ